MGTHKGHICHQVILITLLVVLNQSVHGSFRAASEDVLLLFADTVMPVYCVLRYRTYTPTYTPNKTCLQNRYVLAHRPFTECMVCYLPTETVERTADLPTMLSRICM